METTTPTWKRSSAPGRRGARRIREARDLEDLPAGPAAHVDRQIGVPGAKQIRSSRTMLMNAINRAPPEVCA
jgi:hypothetical protein